ncbi:hypothetical protein GJ699_00305 [Duganella sp. FT80W]|uniref:HEPN domain-containing protein n=1 Tax=Duganella guangzhouensis TaxID=2666084 RepID=A0A6I2KRY0_9BURK|nr:hypothetical protein [Duganella guangzhouensis]MRW88425.1 hypothetical protein [Duganella guangzhouensis]
MSTNISVPAWPATKATAPSRMLWMADGFAEGAQVLCNAMAAEDYYPQYTNTRVILHLCRHATELFLKGAIAFKTKQFIKTHRLDILFEKYQQHYPSANYQIAFPFPKSVFVPREGLFPDILEEFVRTHDQRFRYPIDNTGEPFQDVEEFKILDYQSAIDQFRADLNIMVWFIESGRPPDQMPELFSQRKN